MNKKFFPIWSVFLLVLVSCSNNSTDDLIDVNDDTVVTYNNQIKAVIQANCISCHSDPPQNFAPNRLTTYQDVRNAVLTQGLIDRISREQGSSGFMPTGGTRLPQSVIDLFIRWQAEGLAE